MCPNLHDSSTIFSWDTIRMEKSQTKLGHTLSQAQAKEITSSVLYITLSSWRLAYLKCDEGLLVRIWEQYHHRFYWDPLCATHAEHGSSKVIWWGGGNPICSGICSAGQAHLANVSVSLVEPLLVIALSLLFCSPLSWEWNLWITKPVTASC